MTRRREGLHEALPVNTAARLTGLSPDLIRAWEKRYQVVAPRRGPRGARLYGTDDIARLRLLRRLVDTGRRIGDVAHLKRPELEALASRTGEDLPDTAPPGAPRRLLEALDGFDAEALARELGESLVALGAAAFVREIGAPFLVEVGERWSDGRLTVADEHLVSGLLRNLLGGLVHARGNRSSSRIILATPVGERHDLGLVMAGLLAADAGLSLYFLGAAVPAEDLVRAARRAGAAVVGLSLVDGGNHEQACAEIGTVARALPAATELWLGGRAAEPVARALPTRRALVLTDPQLLDEELRRVRDSPKRGARQ